MIELPKGIYLKDLLLFLRNIGLRSSSILRDYENGIKPLYENLCSYLSSGPIVAMILEGDNAILENRKLMGATDPKKAEENTIRKQYGISIDKNSVHGSDSSENAKKEINFFFKN